MLPNLSYQQKEINATFIYLKKNSKLPFPQNRLAPDPPKSRKLHHPPRRPVDQESVCVCEGAEYEYLDIYIHIHIHIYIYISVCVQIQQ